MQSDHGPPGESHNLSDQKANTLSKAHSMITPEGGVVLENTSFGWPGRLVMREHPPDPIASAAA